MILPCDKCCGNGFITASCGCREAICTHITLENPHDPQLGLYIKYWVRRTDGTSKPGGKHHACEYFVLDLTHDPLALAAVIAYASACEETNRELANDLRSLIKVMK